MRLRATFFTGTGVYPPSLGGPAIHLHYLCSKFRELGVTVEIFDFSSLRHFRETFFRFFRATKHLTASNVIIFNSPPIGILFLMSCLGRVLKKKTVFICHGGIFFETKGPLSKIDRRILIFQLGTRIIEHTVVPSRWLANFISVYSEKTRLTVIPNGIDVEELDSYPTAKLRTKNNILFVGRLAKIKGITTLVDAFCILNKLKHDYNLYIVGPRGDLSQNEIDRIKETPSIYLLGKVSHERKFSLIKGVDVVVVPSLWENFPIVVLESMACGKPTIAADVGGIPELIEDGYNGILIPKKDKDALVKAVSFLTQNFSKAKKIGKTAKKTVREKFTLDIMIQKYLKTIEDVSIDHP